MLLIISIKLDVISIRDHNQGGLHSQKLVIWEGWILLNIYSVVNKQICILCVKRVEMPYIMLSLDRKEVDKVINLVLVKRIHPNVLRFCQNKDFKQIRLIFRIVHHCMLQCLHRLLIQFGFYQHLGLHWNAEIIMVRLL